MKTRFGVILIILSALYLYGCTCPNCTLPPPPPPTTHPKHAAEKRPPYRIHIVSRGETLWRISKRYNVNLHDLIAVNHIQDPSHVIAGTRLIIPSSHYKSKASSASFSPTQKASISKEGFIWPVHGKVTTFYGRTKSKVSKGIDIQAPLGAPVKATQSGKVIFSGVYGPFGNTVIIQHPHGFSSVYAHNKKNLVKVGQWVRQGQSIATVGSSGHASFPSLHFEIRKKSKAVDPLIYLRSP
ncbi:MAG: hypothetical protein DSY91_06735 [Deltaproteobacteria bacterium]|nr:MAG: hypothetical protein DSY91_06735 [Deltaproteobacteria bacterium]